MINKLLSLRIGLLPSPVRNQTVSLCTNTTQKQGNMLPMNFVGNAKQVSNKTLRIMTDFRIFTRSW